MAPKRKAAAKAVAEEPPAKETKAAPKAAPKAKAEASTPAEAPKAAEPPKAEEAPKVEEPKAEEPKEAEPKEKEQDDKKDARPSMKDPVAFLPHETTLNVVPTMGGKCLAALQDGGMQFLIAGARANVGLTAGRYYYEVKVIEALTPAEGRVNGRNRVPMPRQLVRLGFSLANSSLIMGDGGDGCVCFDSEGFFYADKKRNQASARFGREQAIGVLLNLDPKSPNANTVSLFSRGARVSEPQPLPEKLKGQPLYPHVAFRNVTLQVNFGPAPLAELPFKCRMIQEAATADVKVSKPAAPKDGKYEVLFPVAFPDEGTFDWLDGFLEKHPDYVELSDRKIHDWAVKSGIWKPRTNSWKHSNDKPEFSFGLQHMDDFSIHRCIHAIAIAIPRNYVVMEVKQNLTQAERKTNLNRFKAPHFKRVAQVVMGEPSKEYKATVHKKILEEKQNKAEAEWKMRKLEKERKKAVAQRQKELAEQKAAAEAKKKEEADAKMKDASEEAAEGEKKEGEEKKEEAAEAKKEEAAEEKKEEEEEADEPMPQVELTEEEQKINFKPPTTCDIAHQVMTSSFNLFCIPEKDEGFDEIRYEWQDEAKSKAYLKNWVLEKKISSRIDDLQPSEWFKTKADEFQKACKEWQSKQKEFKASKKPAPKAGDGEEKNEDEEDDSKMNIDIFSVDDICDVGDGEPLFNNFTFEDWALLTLRFELHLLQAAFKHDVDDPERIGIHESHLLFYFSKYFKKQLNPKSYGKDTLQEVVELVREAVRLDEVTKVLVSVLKEEPEAVSFFAKLQEESRRKRQQRIDAGDETARLTFSVLQQQQEGGGWSPAPRQAKGAPKGEAAPPAPAAEAVGPRVVPAPRAQAWQQAQQQRPPQGGKAGGGRWQQTYAPRIGGKTGKK